MVFDPTFFDSSFFDTDGGADTNASAGSASGSGSAFGASISIKPNASASTATGSATNSVASIAAGVGSGSGTGTSGGPSSSVSAATGSGAGSGSGFDATVSTDANVSTDAEAASGSGSSGAASTSIASSGGVGTSTGAAAGPSSSASVSAGSGAGSGSASDTTVTTVPGAAPNAGLASGTGSSLGTSQTVKPGSGVASGTGTASTATPKTQASAGHASGTGTSPSSSILTGSAPRAGLASGTGSGSGIGAGTSGSGGSGMGAGGAGSGLGSGGSGDDSLPATIFATSGGSFGYLQQQAGVVHAFEGDFIGAAVGPFDATQAKYSGSAEKITTHIDSPAQWDDNEIYGPDYPYGVYRGRSAAIHVFGIPEEPTPPSPVPACKCCEEAGRNASSAAIVSELFARTNANAWGVSEIDNIPWGISTGFGGGFSVTPGSALIPLLGQADLSFPSGSVFTEPFSVLTKLTIPAGPNQYQSSIFLTSATAPTMSIDVQLYRETSTVGTQIFARWPGGSFAGNTLVSGLASGYSGVPIYVRVTVAATIEVRVWLASGSEPVSPSATYTPSTGTFENPTTISLFCRRTSLTVHEVTIDSYTADGEYVVTGSPVTTYQVSSVSADHTSPPYFNNFKSDGWRVNSTSAAAGAAPWATFSAAPGVTPHWTRSTALGGTLSSQREWLAVPGTYRRFKVDFDPTLGFSPGLGPVGVALFPDLGRPTLGTGAGSTVNYSSDPTTALVADSIVAAGTWVETHGRDVYISPQTLSGSVLSYSGERVYWAGARLGTVNPLWTAVFAQGAFGYPIAQDGYDPWIITVEDFTGAVFELPAAGSALGDCEDECGGDVDCTDDSAINTTGWEWLSGAGRGVEAQQDTTWFLEPGSISLDANADTVRDSVAVGASGASYPDLITFLRGGTFTISGVFNLPYVLSTHSPTETANISLSINFSGPPAITLEAGTRSDSIGNRVQLSAPSILNVDSVFPSAHVGGAIPWTMTVSPTGVTAVIAGQSLSVTATLDLSTITDLFFSLGQGPTAFSGTFSSGGTFGVDSLVIERADETVAPWCVGGGGGLLVLTHGFANRTSAYGVQRLQGESTILNGPQFRSTMSSSSDWARVGGGGDTDTAGDDESDKRAMITHTAPDGATTAKLKLQMRGSYAPAGPIANYDTGVGLPDPPLIQYAIWAGTWGASLPDWGDVGAALATGTVETTKWADDPHDGSQTYGYTYLPNMPESEIEVTIPVVAGLVQFAIGFNPIQTEFLGRQFVGGAYEYDVVSRYDDTPDGWGYSAEIFWSPWGNTNPTSNRGYTLEFYDADEGVIAPCNDCAECEDPENPGFPIPDFEPGYLPTFRRQIGDPTTSLDSFICTLESAAMVLDWHTRGAVKVWGGELIPWCGKTESQIIGVGTNLGNARQAWTHWGQILDVRSGQTWSDLMACLAEGRAVVLQGDYGEFSLAERCQDNFVDNHAISVYPYQNADRLLVGDPICLDFKGFKESSLRAYAEALGAAVFGAQSPQPILFAVSRPWTP